VGGVGEAVLCHGGQLHRQGVQPLAGGGGAVGHVPSVPDRVPPAAGPGAPPLPATLTSWSPVHREWPPAGRVGPNRRRPRYAPASAPACPSSATYAPLFVTTSMSSPGIAPTRRPSQAPSPLTPA